VKRFIMVIAAVGAAGLWASPIAEAEKPGIGLRVKSFAPSTQGRFGISVGAARALAAKRLARDLEVEVKVFPSFKPSTQPKRIGDWGRVAGHGGAGLAARGSDRA
jgi:hypothetical protein